MKINRLKQFLLGILLIISIVTCGKKEAVQEETARPIKTQVIGNEEISIGYTASAEIKVKKKFRMLQHLKEQSLLLMRKMGIK